MQALAESNHLSVASGSDGRKTETQPDSSLVNRWYFEGCLTGCASGYFVGLWIGREQATDSRRKQSAPDGPVPDWPRPQGRKSEIEMKEIQAQLDDILSNEVRQPSNGFPEPLPRVISNPQQLPVRHAGIYSTFHAAVHDGVKDGYISEKPGSPFVETNKYLKNYAATHPPGLPPGVANEILQQHMVVPID
jgi:hypothetical protein